MTWYGYERDPTPVAVGHHRVHARRPRPQTVPRHGPTPGGLWFVDSLFFTKQRWRYDVQGGHDAEKRCAAHVMRGPRSCSVVSAGDLSGP